MDFLWTPFHERQSPINIVIDFDCGYIRPYFTCLVIHDHGEGAANDKLGHVIEILGVMRNVYAVAGRCIVWFYTRHNHRVRIRTADLPHSHETRSIEFLPGRIEFDIGSNW